MFRKKTRDRPLGDILQQVLLVEQGQGKRLVLSSLNFREAPGRARRYVSTQAFPLFTCHGINHQGKTRECCRSCITKLLTQMADFFPRDRVSKALPVLDARAREGEVDQDLAHGKWCHINVSLCFASVWWIVPVLDKRSSKWR